MNESEEAIEHKAVKAPVYPLPPKGHKRTEAEAALRGVDRVVFGDLDHGHDIWYRSFAFPEQWYQSAKDGDRWISGEDMYKRVQAERGSLSYMHAGIPYGNVELASYDVVCSLVSRFLRKQVSYKQFREEFWRAVEGERRQESVS